ncbi:Na+/H+ antiporter [Acuticoccus sediminis]|uniref:Na+/H+ antiporter n=1 Tax=Acuticoccus sediminis TaxID=2184697 RepID=A0A8B2NTM9_9HYPH|nr:Na+/H+ antiporter [Acuticoccus sediminis]RAI02311.1 Na+/H+ antiporter [Acuticoccus sediminis]
MIPVDAALILLAAVVASAVCGRLVPGNVPLPLVQIGIGVILAGVADLGVTLDPQVFFLLFLPPLLFRDGWRSSQEALWRDRGTILSLSLGLVVFTVAGVGFFIAWLIPAMPLPIAFALAAIVSPTDPLAVSAIAERVPVPTRLMRVLEGESLLNDASGLVCMRFAVAAALSGTFSLVDALGTFAWLAVGGVTIGAATTWLVALGREWIARRYGEDPGSTIVLSLLIPFGASFMADMVGASAVLAAVAAGVVMSIAEQRGTALAITRVRRTAVWETVYFVASGVVFILLGEQLPTIVDGAATVVREAGHREPIWLALYVFAICLALALIRFIWVWASLRFVLYRMGRRSVGPQAPGWRVTAAMTVAGVRGAVTLAGIMTLPLTLTDGQPLPGRDLAIFLSAGIIIVLLIAASLLLPVLLRDLRFPPEPSEQAAEDEARIAASKAALAALASVQRTEIANSPEDANRIADSAARLVTLYQQRIDALAKSATVRDEGHRGADVERKLRLVSIRAERNEIYRRVRSRKLSEDAARKLVREIDLLEARFGPE